ncbi:MAG: hypothetical protein N2651_04440, partial [Fimbriimonadales bacterium]|nr:hypothetical protein [Fimbriimonadales bacterium]
WRVGGDRARRVSGWLFLTAALYFPFTAGWAGQPRYRLQVFPYSLPVMASIARRRDNEQRPQTGISQGIETAPSPQNGV